MSSSSLLFPGRDRPPAADIGGGGGGGGGATGAAGGGDGECAHGGHAEGGGEGRSRTSSSVSWALAAEEEEDEDEDRIAALRQFIQSHTGDGPSAGDFADDDESSEGGSIPLSYEWAFYFQKADGGREQLGSFSTISRFWGFWTSLMTVNGMWHGWSIMMFKSSIRPTLSDSHNEGGGKWIIPCALRSTTASVWPAVVMAIISQQVPLHGMSGVKLAIGKENANDVVAVWVQDVLDARYVDALGAALARVLKQCSTKELRFESHTGATTHLSASRVKAVDAGRNSGHRRSRTMDAAFVLPKAAPPSVSPPAGRAAPAAQKSSPANVVTTTGEDGAPVTYKKTRRGGKKKKKQGDTPPQGDSGPSPVAQPAKTPNSAPVHSVTPARVTIEVETVAAAPESFGDTRTPPPSSHRRESSVDSEVADEMLEEVLCLSQRKKKSGLHRRMRSDPGTPVFDPALYSGTIPATPAPTRPSADSEAASGGVVPMHRRLNSSGRPPRTPPTANASDSAGKGKAGTKSSATTLLDGSPKAEPAVAGGSMVAPGGAAAPKKAGHRRIVTPPGLPSLADLPPNATVLTPEDAVAAYEAAQADDGGSQGRPVKPTRRGGRKLKAKAARRKEQAERGETGEM